MINKLFKSVIDQDKAPVVICDMDSIIVYMNPASIKKYHADLTGRSIKTCHNAESNEKIEKVLTYFKKSHENNIVHTFHNDRENKDVYMVALRDENGELIGYYEKHEFRNRENIAPYSM